MSKWRRWIAIIIAVYLLLVLLDRFVLVDLFRTRCGLPLAAALFESLALVGIGYTVRSVIPSAARNLLRRETAGDSSPSARLGMTRWSELDLARDLLVGYPIFGALCFLLGLVTTAAPLMLAIVVVAGVWGIYAVVRRFESRPLKLDAIVFPWPVAVVAIVGVVMAQAPPASLDELAYHLAVPWTWVKEGRAIALPLLSHSYFPLGIESADLPLLSILGALSGGIASHFLHLTAAIATTFVAWQITKGNALATAAIVAMPALAITAGWSLVDWPLVGLTLVALEAVDVDDACFVAALGAGLLTKYTFIPIAVVMVAASRKWRAALPAIAIGCVFFARNLVLTGNPIAPFFTALSPHVAHYRAAELSGFVFDGSYIDESLGASALALLPLTTGVIPIALAIAVVGLILLGPSARVLLPFLAVPAVAAARNLAQSRTMRVLLAVAVVLQLFLTVYFVDRSGVLSLLGAKQSDEQYLVNARSSYTTVESIDALLPPGAVALVVGLNETYWFEHRVRGGGNFDGPRLSAYLAQPTPDALYAKLKRDGITHVAVVSLPVPTAVEKKVEERETALSPEAQRSMSQTLDRYAAGVMSRGAATVFTLR